MSKSPAVIALACAASFVSSEPESWAGSYVAYCTCDKVDNYSSQRTMGIGSNWKFELECNGHSGHGYCSGDVDSGHGAGCGAMTGSLKLYTATQMKKNDCPDDHHTCFRGPSFCDSGGSWGNTCRCDTAHSTGCQFCEFASALSLTSGLDVLQNILYNPIYGRATYSGRKVVSQGTCSPAGQQVWWNNTIKEHDPICCDDSMGTVVAGVKPSGANWTVDGSYAQTTLYDDGNPGTWSVAQNVHGFNCRTVTDWCGGKGEYIYWDWKEGLFEYCCPGRTPTLVALHTYRCD